MNSPLPKNSKGESYFYFHLRHPKDHPHNRIVVALSKSIKGPFYKVPNNLRCPSKHPLYYTKIIGCNFEYFKNLRVILDSEQQKKFYLNEKNEFILEGKNLDQVQSPDEIFSLLVPSSSNNNPQRLRLNSTVLPDEPILNSSANQLPNQDLTYIYQDHVKEYVNIPVQSNNNQFNLSKINELVSKIKGDGLTIFDPIRHTVIIWVDTCENLLNKYNSIQLFHLIIPNFLEKVSLYYFNYLKASNDEFEFSNFKKLFVLKFTSFKQIKIEEAFDYKYQRSDLEEYVKKNII